MQLISSIRATTPLMHVSRAPTRLGNPAWLARKDTSKRAAQIGAALRSALGPATARRHELDGFRRSATQPTQSPGAAVPAEANQGRQPHHQAARPRRTPTMGWFSGQSKAAKELERKRQQEKDEENAKKADDVCEEQKTPYQKKV